MIVYNYIGDLISLPLSLPGRQTAQFLSVERRLDWTEREPMSMVELLPLGIR